MAMATHLTLLMCRYFFGHCRKAWHLGEQYQVSQDSEPWFWDFSIVFKQDFAAVALSGF